MIVCKHGDVNDFCEKMKVVIAEEYEGEISEYNGVCRVLVTDQEMSENEYLYLKKRMLLAGVELVSIWHEDAEDMARHLVYTIHQEKEDRRKFVGRCKFGFHRVNGEEVPHEGNMKVVRRILELRDLGYTYGRIRIDDGVHSADGRKLSISTIAEIVKNREVYERVL
jgi:hypothetical protein